MNLFNRDFDPLAALQKLEANQTQLYRNQDQLNQNIKLLVVRINEQQSTIDSLLKAIDVLNKTNELALQQMAASMLANTYSSSGQH